MENGDAYYRAMLARDYRFDGKFFVGVKTTGIYCRPICPARPLRRNVEFFPSAHLAEKSGYRPCLRCRPEAALPVAEVGFAAGFDSVRRFNAAFRERFKKPPSGIRRAKSAPGRPMMLTLPFRPPFDFQGLLDFYARHAIAGLERFEPGRYTRVVSVRDQPGTVSVTLDEAGNRLLIAYDPADASAIASILNRVRRMFDLDSDPLLIANAMGEDKALSGLLAKRPGVRIPTGWDPFETAIASILGQLVSVAQGRRLLDDVVRLYGSPSGLEHVGKPILLFPSPHTLARADFAGLGTTGNRKSALAAFAAEVASGRLSLEPTQAPEDFQARLLAIPGIGRWTADYMALRVLGHADAFPATDLVLARALAVHSKEAIARVSPWRGYAAILLWGEHATAASIAKPAKTAQGAKSANRAMSAMGGKAQSAKTQRNTK